MKKWRAAPADPLAFAGAGLTHFQHRAYSGNGNETNKALLIVAVNLVILLALAVFCNAADDRPRKDH